MKFALKDVPVLVKALRKPPFRGEAIKALNRLEDNLAMSLEHRLLVQTPINVEDGGVIERCVVCGDIFCCGLENLDKVCSLCFEQARKHFEIQLGVVSFEEGDLLRLVKSSDWVVKREGEA